MEDSRGRLWVGTNNQGVLRYEKDAFTPITETTTLLSGSIRAMCEDREGNIIVGSTGGIALIRPDASTEIIDTTALQDSFIRSLTCDREGRIWGVTNSGNVFALKDGRLLHFLPKSFWNGNDCLSIFQDSQGRLLLGTLQNQVLLLQEENDIFSFTAWTTGDKIAIQRLFEDREHRVWACADNGIGYFDETNTFHSLDGILVDNSTETMIQDYEGNYWIASSRQGVLQLIHNKFQDISFEAQIPKVMTNATQIYNGNLYVATDDGLIILENGTHRIENDLTRLLKKIRVRNFCVDSTNNLWIATYGKYGVIRYKDGQWTSFNTENSGLTNNKARVIMERKNGDMLIGTGDGLNVLSEGRVTETWPQKTG